MNGGHKKNEYVVSRTRKFYIKSTTMWGLIFENHIKVILGLRNSDSCSRTEYVRDGKRGEQVSKSRNLCDTRSVGVREGSREIYFVE